ncbi:MAG: dTDP-4-dehydrorhamnose reductase [Rhizomicrobium sp.]|jgi:dTDP-4-dehydrorhamnose reductase
MKLLIIGRTGQVGRELAGVTWPAQIDATLVDRSSCDLTDRETILRALRDASPDLVVNAAAYTAVDRAESEPELARLTNSEGPAALATGCRACGAALIHLSTDYVFDGAKAAAWLEDDAANPLSVYGRTKWQGECLIRDTLDQHIILRTSWVFAGHGNNFVKTMLRIGKTQDEVRVVSDQLGSPTAARDIANAIATIAQAVAGGEERWGTYHYASAEPVRWNGFAEAIFAASGQKVRVAPITSDEFGARAKRPANSVLDCTRIRLAYGIERPSWHAALSDVISELRSAGEIL